MSLQSNASVPPPPLIPGSVNIRTAQITKTTKTFDKVIMPNWTSAERVSAGNVFDATAGQVVYDTDLAALFVWVGPAQSGSWEQITSV